MDKLNNFFNRKYSWKNGYIKFFKDCKIETTWGTGIIKTSGIIDTPEFIYFISFELIPDEITSERSKDHSSVITSNTSERSKDHSSVLAETYKYTYKLKFDESYNKFTWIRTCRYAAGKDDRGEEEQGEGKGVLVDALNYDILCHTYLSVKGVYEDKIEQLEFLHDGELKLKLNNNSTKGSYLRCSDKWDKNFIYRYPCYILKFNDKTIEFERLTENSFKTFHNHQTFERKY